MQIFTSITCSKNQLGKIILPNILPKIGQKNTLYD
jgi:hypothetical protein